MKNQNTEFEALFNKAWAAGKAAAATMKPTPVAFQTTNSLTGGFDWNKPYEVVEDGVCGFAWISLREASKAGRKDSPFVKWLREQGRGERFSEYGYFEDYTKCWQIWVRGYGQSMQRKESYAEAFAAVLRENGITAYAGSRMD